MVANSLVQIGQGHSLNFFRRVEDPIGSLMIKSRGGIRDNRREKNRDCLLTPRYNWLSVTFYAHLDGMPYLPAPACRNISSATTVKTRKLGIFATLSVPHPRDVPVFLMVTRPCFTSTACTCDQRRNSRSLPMPCWLTLNDANVRVCPTRIECKAWGTSYRVMPWAIADPSSAMSFVKLLSLTW
jgi:hypothetical protein